MAGRRINRQSQKYNPMFLLFLGLAATVVILSVLAVALGIRLKSTNKSLDAAEKEVAELTETVSQLRAQLAEAENGASGGTAGAASSSDAAGGSGSEAGAAENTYWLDLSGNTEVSVAPSELLADYETYYTTAGVNVRSGPDKSYSRITSVDLGTKVDVAARQDNWSFVRVGTRYGWIRSDYLSETAPRR